MAIFVEWTGRKGQGLQRYCERMQAAFNPRSKILADFREDFRLTVAEAHHHMLLDNLDRFGKTRHELADSTLKNKYRGPGPSLIPRGINSRFITNFYAFWELRGGVMSLVCGYRDILSKPSKKEKGGGKPFARYHMTGGPHLPRRDTGGIDRQGFARIQKRFAQFSADVARFSRGFAGVA